MKLTNKLKHLWYVFLRRVDYLVFVKEYTKVLFDLRSTYTECKSLQRALSRSVESLSLKQIKNCSEKRVYYTSEAAEYAALALWYFDGRTVHEYECPVCHHWHLTKSNTKSKLVNKDLLYWNIKERDTQTIEELLDPEVLSKMRVLCEESIEK